MNPANKAIVEVWKRPSGEKVLTISAPGMIEESPPWVLTARLDRLSPTKPSLCVITGGQTKDKIFPQQVEFKELSLSHLRNLADMLTFWCIKEEKRRLQQ